MRAPGRRPITAPATKPIDSRKEEVADLQRQLSELIRATQPFSSGRLIEFSLDPINIPTGSAQQYLKHGLGRKPVGWIVADLVCPQIAVFPSRGDWTDKYIQIVADRICSGKVWVF